MAYSCSLGLWSGRWLSVSRAVPADVVVQSQCGAQEGSLPLHVQPVAIVGGRLWRSTQYNFASAAQSTKGDFVSQAMLLWGCKAFMR